MPGDCGETPSDVDSIFTAGIACHAVAAAEDAGLFEILQRRDLSDGELCGVSERDRVRVEGVLRALVRASIVEPGSGGIGYALTRFGRRVAGDAAVFKLWFQGYAGLFQQPGMLSGTEWSEQRARVAGRTVAEASAAIGARLVDADLVGVIAELGPQSAICDLGCGTANRLMMLCQRFGVDGVGFDVNADAVAAAQEHLRRQSELNVSVECQDVAALTGVWPKVDIVIQTFMTHHLVPDAFCASVLGSYRQTFPDAKYLVVLDTVTPTGAPQPHRFTAGFDYIHRVQGLIPRSRADALSLFRDAGLRVTEEVVLGVPHSYLWVLEWTDASAAASA